MDRFAKAPPLLALGLFAWTTIYAAAEEVAVPPQAELRKMIETQAKYLALPPDERDKAKAPAFDHPPLTRAASGKWRKALWQAWVEHIKAGRPEKLRKLGDPLTTGRGAVQATEYVAPDKQTHHTMKYFSRKFGKKPGKGWPLYINLHGGGDNKKLNDRAWGLTKSQYPIKVGLYLSPRSVVDAAESWYASCNYPLLGRLLAEACALWEVDPNRIYVMGYSMGGWGTFHLGPAIPDRWAAVAASAGAGFVGATGRCHPDNLRNTPMMIQIGTRDLAFRRYPLSKAFAKALQDLHAKDPDGYVVKFREHKGAGHSINDRDTPGWLAGFTRDPLPKRIVWQQIIPSPGTTIEEVKQYTRENFGYRAHFRRRCYWLRNDDPGPFQRVVALREENTFKLEETRFLKRLTILLNDRLVDLDRPLRVEAGGKVLFEGRVRRSVRTLVSTLVERGDPELVFSAELAVKPPDLAEESERREPRTFEEHRSRAEYRMAMGRLDEATADLESALKLDPARGPTKIFPLLLRMAGKQKDEERALEVHRRWAAAAPEDAKVLGACAYAYLKATREDLRDPKRALVHARKAVKLTQRKNSKLLQILALACHRTGASGEAVKAQREAIARMPKGLPAAYREHLKKRLKEYLAAEEKQ